MFYTHVLRLGATPCAAHLTRWHPPTRSETDVAKCPLLADISRVRFYKGTRCEWNQPLSMAA